MLDLQALQLEQGINGHEHMVVLRADRSSRGLGQRCIEFQRLVKRFDFPLFFSVVASCMPSQERSLQIRFNVPVLPSWFVKNHRLKSIFLSKPFSQPRTTCLSDNASSLTLIKRSSCLFSRVNATSRLSFSCREVPACTQHCL